MARHGLPDRAAQQQVQAERRAIEKGFQLGLGHARSFARQRRVVEQEYPIVGRLLDIDT
jgi:hypothetical protein